MYVKQRIILGVVLLGLTGSAMAEQKLPAQEASERLQQRGILRAAHVGHRSATRDELSVMLQRLDELNNQADKNFASRQEVVELRDAINQMRGQAKNLDASTTKVEEQTEQLDQR